MNAYAVLRYRKIKSWGNVASSGQHNTRKRDTPNADPSRRGYNRLLAGSDADLEAVVKGMIGNQKVRKNAVLALEVVLSASPIYFRPDAPERGGTWDQGRLDAWVDATMKWLKKQYGERIAQAVLHLDEQTPHIHAVIVPLDDKGKLNARALIGGPSGLRELQTSYANSLKELGIMRGIEGSSAKHETVREYYHKVNKAFEYLPVVTAPEPGPEPKPPPKKGIFSWREDKKAREEWEKKHAEWEEKRKKRLAEERVRYSEAARLARENEARFAEYNRLKDMNMGLKEENSRLRKENLNLKQQIEMLRGIDLAGVLTTLYGGVEAKDSKPSYRTRKFKLPGRESNIAITGSKWIDNATKQGGVGALNLVMYLEGFGQDRFTDAVRLLSDRYPDATVIREVGNWVAEEASTKLPEIKQKPVPAPDRVDKTWEKARTYLVHKRKIPADLVDRLHAEGIIYSDRRNNIVFVRSAGGAFVRGSYDPIDKPAFKQTVGSAECGPFILDGKNDDIIITEGAIDALTLKAKFPDSTVLATGGNFPTEKLTPYLGRFKNIFLAHDNDPAGHEQAKRIQDEYKGRIYQRFIRLLPPAPAKDWNEAAMKEEEAMTVITKRSMGDYGYEILPRPAEVGGGYRLRLLEREEEIAGGIYPAEEYKTPENDWDEADKRAFAEAEAEAESWLAAMSYAPKASNSLRM